MLNLMEDQRQEKKETDFDELLVEHIGEFGKYQKCMFGLLLCVSVTVAFNTFIHAFTGINPGIICIQTYDEIETNLDDTELGQTESNITEYQDDLFKCLHLQDIDHKSNNEYDSIKPKIISNGDSINETFPGEYSEKQSRNYGSGKRNCIRYGFDNTKYSSTIVTQWILICEKKWQVAFSQSLLMTGCLLGSSLLGGLTDRYGRKSVLQICTALNTLCGIGAAFSFNVWMYSGLRLFGGATQAAQFNASYILCLEIVGPKRRALAAVVILMFNSLGMIMLAGLAMIINHWRLLQLAISLPGVLLTVLYLCFLDESPRWLLAQKREKEAYKIIQKMVKINKTHLPPFLGDSSSARKTLLTEHKTDKITTCEKLTDQNSEDNNSQNDQLDNENSSFFRKQLTYSNPQYPSVKSKEKCSQENYRCEIEQPSKSEQTVDVMNLFKSKLICFRTCILTVIWFNISVTYYGLSLSSSSLAENGTLIFFFIGLVEIPAYIMYVFLNRKCYRREPIAISLLVSCVVLWVSSLFDSGSISLLVLYIMGKFCISLTYASVYPFATELYPTVLRTIGLGVSSLGARTGALVAPFINLLGDVNGVIPLLVFGAFSIAGVFLTYFLPEPNLYPLPETVQDAEIMTVSPPRFVCCGNKGSRVDRDNKSIKSSNTA